MTRVDLKQKVFLKAQFINLVTLKRLEITVYTVWFIASTVFKIDVINHYELNAGAIFFISMNLCVFWVYFCKWLFNLT